MKKQNKSKDILVFTLKVLGIFIGLGLSLSSVADNDTLAVIIAAVFALGYAIYVKFNS